MKTGLSGSLHNKALLEFVKRDETFWWIPVSSQRMKYQRREIDSALDDDFLSHVPPVRFSLAGLIDIFTRRDGGYQMDFIPDAYSINPIHNIISLLEVEHHSKITLTKLKSIANLYWILDQFEWRLALTVLDARLNVVKEVSPAMFDVWAINFDTNPALLPWNVTVAAPDLTSAEDSFEKCTDDLQAYYNKSPYAPEAVLSGK